MTTIAPLTANCACGAKNRIRVERAHLQPRCGRCAAPLPVGPRVASASEAASLESLFVLTDVRALSSALDRVFGR